MNTNRFRLFSVVLMIASSLASAQTITTIAGDGAATFAGDAGLATGAALNHPRIMAIDAAGNIFVADMDNSRIRRIATNGTITTVAGTGVAGYSGDGGLAASAQLNQPQAVAIDASGNLIIADTQNRRIRRVDASGVITTIAGTGVEGYSGDNGPAVSAQLHQAVDLAVDSTGNIYFADSTGQRIRKISTNGTITTVAGNGVEGFGGDSGPALSAMLDFPVSIAIDAQNTLYISDANNFRIRTVNAFGVMATIAGNGVEGFAGDGGAATSASLNYAYGVRVDSNGRVFVADASNNRVRMVANGAISTIAGTGADGFSGDGGLATNATLNFPWAVAVDASGNVLVSDRLNTRVRKITMATQSAPVLFANGTVNVASYTPATTANGAVAPGSMVAIFGTDLAGGTGRAVVVPLQTTVLDTTVTMNGVAVPLFYVSKTQINAQVPYETALGTVNIQVLRGTQTTSVQNAQVTSTAPGVFTLNQQGTGPGAFLHANFQGISDTNPATGGETILMYATGLGATNPVVATGAAATVTVNTVATPTVTIGGLPATVSFSGLAPTFVGLYQMNVQVPVGLPAGAQQVVVRMNGFTANTTTLSTH